MEKTQRRSRKSVISRFIAHYWSVFLDVCGIQSAKDSDTMGEDQRRAIAKIERRLARLRSNLGYPGNAEPPFVNIHKKKELHYWAVKFGYGKEAVKYAVEHVGTDPEKVETFVYGLR